MNRFKKNIKKEAHGVSRGDHIESQGNSPGHGLSALAALSMLNSFTITVAGSSLVVQWSGCHASSTQGVGLIPGWEDPAFCKVQPKSGEKNYHCQATTRPIKSESQGRV